MTAPGYLESIHIGKTYTHENVDIVIDAENRRFKHLVLVGKNGAGKTSTLTPLSRWLESPNAELQSQGIQDSIQRLTSLLKEQPDHPSARQRRVTLDQLNRSLETWQREFPVRGTVAGAATPLVVHIRAGGNNFEPRPVSGPQAENIEQLKTTAAVERANFIQYLVNQRFELLNLRDEGDEAAAAKLEAWFQSVEENLSQLLGSRFVLKFERGQQFRYVLVDESGRESPLDALPDGWKALIKAFTYLLRIHEAHGVHPITDEAPCVLVFDEPELHLHPKLQWTVLPTLASLFPHVQIVAATQSPIVAASLDNAVLFDLTTCKELPKVYGAPADSVLLSTFGTPLREAKTRGEIRELEQLVDDDDWTAAEAKLAELAKLLPDADPDLARVSNLIQLSRALDGDDHA